jgi:hypothetical protein
MEENKSVFSIDTLLNLINYVNTTQSKRLCFVYCLEWEYEEAYKRYGDMIDYIKIPKVHKI